MFKVENLDPEKVTFGVIVSPGAKYKDRKIIKLSEIYNPPMPTNPVRTKGKNLPHVQKLTKSLSADIDYSRMPPVVKEKTQLIDGKRYEYELIAGNHRLEAMGACNYDRWIFDVYEFALDGYSLIDSVRTFQLIENDHTPALESSTFDVTNSMAFLIENGSKLVIKDEASIASYVQTYLPHLHYQTQAKIIRQVVQKVGASQDVVTYTHADIKNWLEKNTNYKMAGDYDKNRNKAGYTCLSRYEPDTMFSMMKKLHEAGKESYVICHTSAPTQDKSLADKRKVIVDNFDRWEDIFRSLVVFYNNNGRFPWVIEGFLPQDRKAQEDETKLVTVKKSKPINATTFVESLMS
jgi:hypothetical protein